MFVSRGIFAADFEYDVVEEYQYQTLNLHPGAVQSVGWDMPQSTLVQELNNDSLFNDFNGSNSAFLQQAEPDILLPVVETPAPIDTVNPPSSDTVPTEVSNELPASSEGDSTGVEPTPEASDSSVESTTQESENESSSAPASESALQTLSQSFYAFLAYPRELLPFANESIVTDITENVTFIDTPESDILESDGSLETVAVPETSTEQSTVEGGTLEDTLIAPPATDPIVSETVSPVEQSGESLPPEEKIVCVDDTCEIPFLEFSDFNAGENFDDFKITNMQFRLSLAGKPNPEATTEGYLQIEYEHYDYWIDGGIIPLNTEISNATNGGYQLFGFPLYSDWDELKRIKVRITYHGDTEHLPEIFIDSAWLEIEHIHNNALIDPNAMPGVPSLEGPNIPLRTEAPEGYTFAFDELRTEFESDEKPVFAFEVGKVKKEKKFLEKVGNSIMSFFGFEAEEEVAPTFDFEVLTDDFEGSAKVEKQADGAYTVEVEKGRTFTPGKHTLTIEVSDAETNEVFYIDTAFSWGVLALNAEKTMYAPDEEAYLQMGVVDDFGHTVCDATLTLSVTNPTGSVTTLSTSDGTIAYGDECAGDTFTTSPDYDAKYRFDAGVGEYVMKLTAETKNGTHTITDSFSVVTETAFDVVRTGPTRIYPPELYPVTLTITAHEDYRGPVVEFVPRAFQVYEWGSEFRTREEGDAKQLIWNIDIKAGETKILKYKFDAPDESPEFYLLGPLTLGEWKEAREWQIASDAPNNAVIVQSVLGTEASATSYSATFASAPTAGNIVIMVAMHRDGPSAFTAPPYLSQAVLSNAAAEVDIGIWYGATDPATSTYSISKTGGNQTGIVYLMEVSGLATSSLLNATSSNNQTGSTGLISWTGLTPTTTQYAFTVAAVGVGDNDFTNPTSASWTSSSSASYTQRSWTQWATGNDGGLGIATANVRATERQQARLALTTGGVEERNSVIAVFKTLSQYTTVGSYGNQNETLKINLTNQNVGGVFTLKPNTGSTSVTSITITENGTTNAQNDLSNIRLKYEFDSVVPYDCASATYDGTETQYGATSSAFSSANGTSSFSGSVSVSTSSVMCIFTVLDVDSSAVAGDTLELEISTPNTHVVMDQGTATPGTAVALSDTTILQVGYVPTTPVLTDTPAFPFLLSTSSVPRIGGFVSTDQDNDVLEYEFSIDDDPLFGSPATTTYSRNYPNDSGWASTTFNSGATTTYQVPSGVLTTGVTYWWRVRVRDPYNRNEWSSYSDSRSMTVGSLPSVPEWYQTTEAQFKLDGFANATVTGNGIQIETLGAAATNVTTLSAWSQQYASGTYPSGTVNATYPVSAGTDRVLVVAIASTRSTAGTQSVGVYYGGKPLTQATGDGTNATNVNHTYLFYLNDADIALATTTVLNVQITGGTSYYTYVYASVFQGVNQTTVYTDARNYFSGATANATVGPFAAGLTVGQGDQAIEIINLARSAVGNNVRTVTTWSNATWPNPSTVAATLVPATNWGVGLHINNRNATTASTEASGHTANNANTVDSMSGMSLKVAGSGSRGSATSTIIDHDYVANQSRWGEIVWDITEPLGSDSTVRLYYATSSTSTCNTLVPNGTLPGNSAGFDVSASPVNISGLSTSTYNRICLVVNFGQGSSASSPVLNDWTVRWTRTPQFIQEDYLWYQSFDNYTPTSPWQNGEIVLSENTPIDVEGAVLRTDDLRLRMSLTGSSTDASIGSSSFTLQFAESDTCSVDLDWYDVGDTGSTTALWRGFNNPSLSDGTTLPSTLLTNSDVFETYEESNDSYPNPTAINVGQTAEWDWSLYNNLATAGASYCFRMVGIDGKPLRSYTNYPVLVTNSSPGAPTLYTPFDNEKLASTSPWFEFVTNDPEGNEVDYEIQIDTEYAFTVPDIETDSETNLDDFLNINEPSDKSPFNNSSRMRYVIPSSLANNTTYWWRVRAKDVNGSGEYGVWSTPYSFTVATSTVISTWFQTTQSQFDTDTLVGTDATAGNLVAFISGSTTGTTTSTAIDFSGGTIGNAWGAFSFTETGAANDILYHIEYYNDGAWELIPDTALSGNAAGYDTSPVDLLDLDSAIYNIIRIRANFLSGSPTLLDWTVTWGERVSVPTHINPFDNEKFSTTTPTFTFFSTDPDNDDLEYEISWSTDYTFTSGTTTRNSSTSPAGFTNLTTGADTLSPYISGDTIAYKVQTADILSASSTYWWRVRAKDPDGSDSFSFWSDPWSFTTATTGESILVSTWYQTLGLQFGKGTLDGVIAASGSVEIGSGITLESGWTSNTAVPNSTLALTKPTGVQSGNLLLIIVGNDNTTATAQWNNVALKPPGFTLINTAGNATPDAHVAAFYRIADGTENTSINVPAQSSADYWGYYIRLTGVDPTSPVNVTGADYAVNTLLSHPITSITTTVGNTLAFYVLGGDGGDTYPFSVSGTGWTENAEIQAGTGAANAAGTWGTRTMPTAGATGAATVTMNSIDGASGFQFALRPAPATSGAIKSPAIDFDDGSGPAWGQLLWKDIELSGSEILYQLEYLNGVGVWELIPNLALSGNSTGFTTSPINLEGLDTTTYNELRIVGNLDCNGATCPVLNEWTLEWSRGFSISGTAFEYDGLASTTGGTVAVAVNGELQLNKTASIQANGTWTIDDVTFFNGDVITVFVSGANDVDEAVAVTVYDGTPEITGMRLQKRHLSIGSDDRASLTNADLGVYDYSNDEDLFYNVDVGNDLTMCADVSCGDAGIVVLRSNTYSLETGADMSTHNFTNNGTFVSGNNTVRASGSWDDNATSTLTGSTIIFTATSSSESIDTTGATTTGFNHVTLGEGSGTATWSASSTLDINGNLSVTYGTLARNTQQLTIAGNLTTGANGFWSGMGTTTFDGTNPTTWTDSNATKQNIGNVVINGNNKTVLLGSSVVMQSLTIGADDTFDLVASHTASVYGDWINNNTFYARTGTVNFIATTTNKTITAGGDAFYNLSFNGANGSWFFSEADLLIGNDITIATGTVTMPTGTTTVTGSWNSAGGTFGNNAATVLFNSSGAETITASGTPFTNAFWNLRFSGSGSWVFNDQNATTSNDLTITQGTVTFPSNTLTVGGNFTNSGGSFNHNTGTVKFTSSGTKVIDTNASFYSMHFAGAGMQSFVDSNVTALGNITLTNGTTTFPSGTFTIGGSLGNTATITPNNGTVLFNATSTGKTISTGNSSLYNVTLNSTTGGWTITGNATTTNNFTLTAVASSTLNAGLTLSVGGVFTNAANGASTTWAGSVLSLEAGNYSINTKTATGDTYGTLRVKANTDIQMWNSTSTIYDIANTGSLYSQDHNGADGDLYIFGEYARTSGTEYWSYAYDFDGTALGTSSARQVDVRLASGTVATLTGSILHIVGTSTGSTTIANQGVGSYALSVVNGTTTASRYDFTDMGISGLSLSGTTKVTSLANGRFIVSTASGTALSVSSSTVDANPQLQIYGVNFSTTTPIIARNVTQTGVAPSSYWWFREASGNIFGEAFDSDTGDPGSIRWDDSSLVITLSGVVYSDDGATPMGAPTCDGITSNVRVIVYPGTATSTWCAPANGAYSINVPVVGDVTLTTYLNTNGGEKGVVVTKTPTTNIQNHDIYANRVITKHQDVLPLTIADMASVDSSDDTDIPFTATIGTTNTLVLPFNTELHIASSTTFAPGGDITIHGNASTTSQDGSLHIDNNATFTGSGTSTYSIAGSFTMDQGALFTPASTTVVMTATTSGKTINTTVGQEISFNNLRFTGVNGGWNINSNVRALGNIDVATGTVTGTANVTLPYGSMSGNGTVSFGSGTTTIEQTNTLGGTTPWTFANLVLGNGINIGTTTFASNATTTILGKLTIATAHYLSAGGGVLTFQGAGNVFVESGTFIEATSTVRYSGTSGSNVIATSYNNLVVSAQGSSPTFTGTGLGIMVFGDLVVGGTGTTTLNMTTSDPALDVNGSVLIHQDGTFIGSNSGSFTVGGSWDNNGTFTSSGGTVTFDSAGTKTIAAGNSSFNNVTISGAGTFTISEHATATAAFTLTNATSFTVASSTTLAVGGTFTNSIGGGTTVWTGSTLHLYGGNNYQINASTTSDTYYNLLVGANTDIRMWSSQASLIQVDSTASLYSQDHAGSNGALYIYGAYEKSSGTDYWNYATDFDGTALLGGNERKVTVSLASSSSALYTGGGLSVIGSPSASTTLQNQGSGTYVLRLGGTASTTMNYYEVRNTNASGIVFSGTATVNSLSYGDFVVSEAGGSAITVGGTVLSANPPRTFTNDAFSTSTGISAWNVTATGTASNPWRFTNHSGSIDGEAFDVDPAGDPGYIVWDDGSTTRSISGRVFSDEGTSVSTVCDSATSNIRLRVAGLTDYVTSCNGNGLGGGTGAYTFTGVNSNPGDSFIVYIDGEAEKAAAVSEDLISTLSNFDLYENRVIVRHEDTDPLSIADMALWDSSDDADIPFTAVDAGVDTLTLPANRKLIVWDNMTFRPNGNVTLSGGGGGSAYDGTLELYVNAVFDATGSETHSIGGSLISGTGASIDDETSTFTFTTTGASRTIDTNDNALYNLTLNGSGSWTITNTILDIGNDLTITEGTLTLPTGTTTVAGSFSNTGGSFAQNGGHMRFTGTGAEVIRQGGSSFGTTTFAGLGSWTYQDTNATSTGDFIILSGTVTVASGTHTIGGDLHNVGTFTHNSGTLRFTSGKASTTVYANGSDLSSTTFAGAGTFVFTDTNVALRGALRIEQGTVTLATGTMSIAGSFFNSAVFNHASGTILFNSSDTGETINPGNSSFNVVSIAAPTGGYTITGHATTTGNFSLTSASLFTLASSTSLGVQGVFTNLVGGANTTWTGSTLRILSGVPYTINTTSQGGDTYNTLVIGNNTDLRMWNSGGTVTMYDTLSSLYSQDHGAVNGELNIYGNYEKTTGIDYWNYATDFDGTSLTGIERPVTVRIASGATTTFSGGTLQMIGASAGTTTVTNQGTGTYSMNVTGGTLYAINYAMRNMDAFGLSLSGTTTITSISNGDYELAVSGGSLITVSSTTVNYNASQVITGMRFATTSAITGTNIHIVGTTPSAWTLTNHRGNLDGEAFDDDGGDACGSIRWDDSACLLTQQSAYRWRNNDGGEGVPDSEWYDTDWTKRKRILITNNDATTYTDAVVEVSVTWDSDMQPDFDDLRFTSSNGTTLLTYFKESYVDSSSTIAWVKIPSLSASADTEIYMYYGNGAIGDASDGHATFIAFDDYEDGSLTGYSGDTGEFVVNTSANVYERSYSQKASDPTNGKTDLGGMYNNGPSTTVSQGETVRYFQYIDTTSGSADESCTLFGTQSQTQNYAVCLELFGVDRMSLVRNALHRDTSGTVLASTTVTYTTGWYEVEIDWESDDSISVSLFKNNSLVATTSSSDSNWSTGGIGYTLWSYHGAWDIYTSRPLLTTRPTVTFGSEQVSGGASWLAARNTKATGVTTGTVVRPRFMIENTGLSVTDAYRLMFAPKGVAPSCESVSAGAYNPVPIQSSCGTSPICMQASSLTNQASTSDIMGGEGTFTYGQTIDENSNTTQSLVIGSNEYTEVEYAITATTNASSSAYCFRVSDAGTSIDSYTRVAELELLFVPNVTSVSLNGGADFILLPGTTTTIYATGTISDVNGYTDLDINRSTTTIYRSGVTDACSADNNNCYITAGPSKCSFSNCSTVTNSCDISCATDIFYHADPTDMFSPNAGETWRATLSVSDMGGSIATGSAPSIDFGTLRAISVDDAISYPPLEVLSDSGAINPTTTITNIGNIALDLSLEGTDLTDGITSYIPVTSQKFATSSFTYGGCGILTCKELSSTTPVNIEVDIAKPTSTTTPALDDVYWGISIPFGVAGSAHHGVNHFTPVSD